MFAIGKYARLPFKVILTSLTEQSTRVPTIASTEASASGKASPTWLRPTPL